MNNYFFCPVSTQKINEPLARLNALITLSLLIVFLVTKIYLLIVFLVIDYFLRATNNIRYSPIAGLSKYLLKVFRIKETFINAGPKIFAARIGFIFGAVILGSCLAGAITFSLALAGVLALFCLLEGALGICVACLIYPYWFRILYQVRYSN